MSDRDDKMLEEAYDNIQEGMFDRAAANKAGKQAFKDAGGKTGLGGLVQRGAQYVADKAGYSASPELQAAQDAQGGAKTAAQVEALAQRYLVDVQKIAANLQKDMGKLGIKDLSSLSKTDTRSFNLFRAILALGKNLPEVQHKTGQLSTRGGQAKQIGNQRAQEQALKQAGQ